MSTQGPATPPPGWGPPPGGQSPPPGQPPSGPPPQQPPYGYGAPPPYGYGPPPPQPQTDGTAITVLVLSIAAFFLSAVSLGIFAPVGLVLAIVALALCPSAARNIANSGGMKTGEGLVTAARIISWVFIGLCALATVIIVIAIIIAAATDDTNEFSLVVSLFS